MLEPDHTPQPVTEKELEQMAAELAEAKAGAGPDQYGGVIDPLEVEHGPCITDEERELAAEGNALEFWKSREALGDPIGHIGVKSADPPGGAHDFFFGGAAINRRLKHPPVPFAGHPYGFQAEKSGILPESRKYVSDEDIENIRMRLMEKHIEAVENAREPCLPKPIDIARYHHQIFAEFDLPKNTFGGTPLFGAEWEANITRRIWYREHDQ